MMIQKYVSPTGQLDHCAFCIFSCILTLFIILIKPLQTKEYDSPTSGDCGTYGIGLIWHWEIFNAVFLLKWSEV